METKKKVVVDIKFNRRKVEDYRRKHPGTSLNQAMEALDLKPWHYYPRYQKKTSTESAPVKTPSMQVFTPPSPRMVIAFVGDPEAVGLAAKAVINE